eukprot:6178790-Amphidinium_carterae.1
MSEAVRFPPPFAFLAMFGLLKLYVNAVAMSFRLRFGINLVRIACYLLPRLLMLHMLSSRTCQEGGKSKCLDLQEKRAANERKVCKQNKTFCAGMRSR